MAVSVLSLARQLIFRSIRGFLDGCPVDLLNGVSVPLLLVQSCVCVCV